MSTTATRMVSALILALWMSPSIGALGVGLHLALDHHGDLERHGPRGDQHRLEISDLVQAAAHGHHHDTEAVPDHDHDAAVGSPALIQKSSTSWVVALPAPTSPEVSLAERSLLEGSPRRGPPVPLFTTHCCLLL